MAETKKELLQELREELIKEGFDASDITDEELEAWCEKAGIGIAPPPILN